MEEEDTEHNGSRLWAYRKVQIVVFKRHQQQNEETRR